MSRPQRRWTAEEDSILQREVEAQMAGEQPQHLPYIRQADQTYCPVATNGTVHDWNSIAQAIDGRSNKDCRKRFYNGINGMTDLKKNMQLLVAVRTHGTAWKDIQTLHLPSRSANNVKNQYSVLKRHTLEVPPDAPSCCATRTSSGAEGSRNTDHKPHASNDGADLLNQFTNDNDADFDTSHQRNHDADQSYSFPTIHGDDTFHSFETNVLSHSVNTNLISHNFFPGSLDPEPNIDSSSIDLDHDYSLDNYDFQMTDAVADPLSYINSTDHPPSNGELALNSNMNDGDSSPTTRPPIHRNHQHRPSSVQWPPAFSDPGPMQQPSQHKQQQQQQQQQQQTPTPPESHSNPSTPNWQTTIRFSGADPTTVSTVIGVLAKSQAKFIYETH
ncbi:MAG: hypothetical protein Q9178_002336 [Gyalolechia marmorata]